MRKIYHLSTCSTCRRIINELDQGQGFDLQDIKVENISADELDRLKEQVGSYEALFSRRSMKYRAWGLHEQTLTEQDYRRYILQEYTFLKRPVVIIDDEVYVGNAKKTVAAAREHLDSVKK